VKVNGCKRRYFNTTDIKLFNSSLMMTRKSTFGRARAEYGSCGLPARS